MSKGVPLKRLPRTIDPRKLAQNKGELRGFVPVESLQRVSDATHACNEISAQLSFEVDEEGRRVMLGEITAELQLTCQRCLEPLEQKISASITLAMVWDEEEARQLPSHIEPWVTEEAETDLYAIIEEEILLNLPLVAYHEHMCIDSGLLSTGEIDAEPSEPRENPFQMLAQLKQKPKD